MRLNRAAKAFAFGVIAGSLITAGTVFLAAPAHADSTAEAYAEMYGAEAICPTLDSYPTFSGILGIGEAIVDSDGLTYRQAGEAIGIAVLRYCPRHTALMMRFAGEYDPASMPLA